MFRTARAKRSSPCYYRRMDKTHREEAVCEAKRGKAPLMSISIGTNTGYDSFISRLNTDNAKSSAGEAAKLQSKLSSSKLEDASDEELMEVCKSFESYLLEKVLEKTKKTLTDSEEEDSPYMNMFGDKLYQEYAGQITEHGELGLAQQLFEAMKRDFGANRTNGSTT